MDFGSFEISGNALVTVLVLTIVAILALIFVMRNVFTKRSTSGLKEKYQANPGASPLTGRNKYPDVDVFSLSGTFFNFGLMAAIGLVILAFSWTQYDAKIDVSDYMDTLDEIIETEPPRTAEPPPPPPPPPPPVIQEVPEEDIEEEPIEFKDTSIEEDTEIVDAPVADDTPPPPPPPPPPPKPKAQEIFKVVEDMPAFPGCEGENDKAARKKCADGKMLQFIYKNIKYPAIARENGVDGMVVVRFVVEKDGSITNEEIVRDIGAQCGQEALRIVKMMPKWNPGKQRGRPVRVQFNLPVKFKLE